jgi:hypothetical protein
MTLLVKIARELWQMNQTDHKLCRDSGPATHFSKTLKAKFQQQSGDQTVLIDATKPIK